MNRNREIELLGLLCEKAEYLDRLGLGRLQDNIISIKPMDDLKIQHAIIQIAAQSNAKPEDIQKVYEDMACDAIQVGKLSANDVINGIRKGEISFFQIKKEDLLNSVRNVHPSFSDLFDFIDEESQISYIKERILCNTEIYASPSIDYMMMFDFEDYAKKDNLIGFISMVQLKC